MTQDEHERLLRRLAELERDSERFQRELQELRRELAREKGYDQLHVGTADPVEPEAPPEEASLSRRLPIARAGRQIDLEFWIGGRGLLLVGVAALVFAVAFFVKEAIERGWVGPTIRVLAGGGIGVAAAIAGDRIRALGYRTYGLWLSAGGFSAIYLSVWAAASLYALVPISVGFFLMVVVVVVAATIGLLRQSESFVALAAVGGYLAPVLLQAESPSNLFGLGYLALLTGAGLAVANRAGWAYLATVAVLGGSFLALVGTGDPHLHGVYMVALVASSLVVARRGRWPVVSLLAMLLGWVVYWIGSVNWEISGLSFAAYAMAIWLADLLASIEMTDWVDDVSEPTDQLAFRQETEPLAKELCGLAVTALPPWFFFASAMDGIGDSAYSDRAPEIGLVLAAILGAVYLAQAVIGSPGRGAGSRFWRAALGFTFLLAAPRVLWADVEVTRAWLVEGIAFTAVGVALKRAETRAAGLVAFALAVLTYWGTVHLRPVADAAFFSGWALTGLVAVVGLALWAMALERVDEPAPWERAVRPLMLLAAAVLFLTWGTGEIARFFDLKGDLERWRLARDLSISAFWMVYAAALLVLGFWRDQAPIRWAGLVMALIAAAKVFIYDLSNLDRLYRIFSFVLLAAVLLALSFWYQKLRGRDETTSS